LDFDPIAVAGEGAGHDDVALDPRRGEPEYPGGALQLRVEVRINHLFLARETRQRLLLPETLDRLLAGDGPIGFTGPACSGERLGIALGDADLVDMLAEADIPRPAAE